MGKSQGRPVRYEFTEENINVIAAIAAEKGIEAYKEEHRKEEAERQSRVQNNAKALLINYRRDRKSTRLNSSHASFFHTSRMPSSA